MKICPRVSLKVLIYSKISPDSHTETVVILRRPPFPMMNYLLIALSNVFHHYFNNIYYLMYDKRVTDTNTVSI